MAKKKPQSAESYTRENRPSGVSAREWDTAREAEGRDPYAKFFSDPVADRKKAEALSAQQKAQADAFMASRAPQATDRLGQDISTDQPVQPAQPTWWDANKTQTDSLGQGVSRALTPDEQKQADDFIAQKTQPQPSFLEKVSNGLSGIGQDIQYGIQHPKEVASELWPSAKKVAQPIVGGMINAGAALADVGIRTSPLEPLRNYGVAGLSALKTPGSIGDKMRAGEEAYWNDRARQLNWEKITGQSVTNADSSLNPETARQFVGNAMEAPTYLYSGGKAFSSDLAGGVLSRLGQRAVSNLPLAAINTAIQGVSDGQSISDTIKNLPANFAQNEAGLMAFSTLFGELGRYKAKNGSLPAGMKDVSGEGLDKQKVSSIVTEKAPTMTQEALKVETPIQTPEEAAKSFKKSFDRAYNNGPAKVKTSTALDEAKAANQLASERSAYIQSKAGEPKSYSSEDIATYNKKAINAGKEFDLKNQTPIQTGEKVPEIPKENNPIPQQVKNFDAGAGVNTKPVKDKVKLEITGNTEKERIQSAITNHERVKNEITNLGQDAYQAGKKVPQGELTTIRDKYQAGTPIEQIANESSKPVEVKTYLEKVKSYYARELELDHAAGGTTKNEANHLVQKWDLSNPKDLERFSQLAESNGYKYKGYGAQPKVFKNYAEGEAAGFKPLNANINEDLLQHSQGASSVISKQALKQGLQEAAPTSVSVAGMGKTAEGKPFINSNIKGMEDMSFHPDVAEQLKGFNPKTGKDWIKMAQERGSKAYNEEHASEVNTTWNPWTSLKNSTKASAETLKNLPSTAKEAGFKGVLGSIYDNASQPMKHFMLNFSGFHSINVSLNFAGASLKHPIKGTAGLLKSVPSFFSENFTKYIEDGYKSKILSNGKSVFDNGLEMGVNMGRELPKSDLKNVTSLKELGNKINPFNAQSRAIFSRELHTLKLSLVDQVTSDMAKKGILPNSPEGRALGKQINMIMGEMNTRTQNIDTNTQKWLSRVLLAPGFTESKYATIGNALSKGGQAGSLARQAIAGKSLVTGTLATFGTLLATGKFPDLHQLLLNYTIAPETQTNITNASGKKLDIAMPATFVSEPSKPIAGLLSGSTDELTHYAEARLAPALSDAISAYTNKDYYGNPIVDPNSDKPVLSQLMENIGQGDLPIGLQNLALFKEGKQSAEQTAINIIGLRTKVSKEDPTNNMWNAYKAQKDIETLKGEIKYGKVAPKSGEKQMADIQQKLDDFSAKSDLKEGESKLIKSKNGDFIIYKTDKGIAFADDQSAADKKINERKIYNDLKNISGDETKTQDYINSLSKDDYTSYKLTKAAEERAAKGKDAPTEAEKFDTQYQGQQGSLTDKYKSFQDLRNTEGMPQYVQMEKRLAEEVYAKAKSGEMTPEEKAYFTQLLTTDKKFGATYADIKKTGGMTNTEKDLASLGVRTNEKALRLIENLKSIPVEQQKAYVHDLYVKKIISKEVIDQVNAIRKGQ